MISKIISQKPLFTSLILFLMISGAIFEAFSVGLLFKYFSAFSEDNLSQPIILLDFSVLNLAVSLEALGILTIVSYALGLVIRYSSVHSIIIFSNHVEVEFSMRAVRAITSMSFERYFENSAAHYSSLILSELKHVTNGYIIPFFTLVSQMMMCAAILIVLFLIDARATLAVFSVLALSFLVIFVFSSRIVKKSANLRLLHNEERFSNLRDITSLFVSIASSSSAKFFLQRFSDSAHGYALANIKFRIASMAPRYIVEGLALFIICIFVVTSEVDMSSNTMIMAKVIAFVSAAMRLLPYAQNIYSNLVNIKYYSNTARNCLNLINMPQSPKQKTLRSISRKKIIKFANISYKFPESKVNALCSISGDFFVRKFNVIHGRSGAGKSTLCEIIFGFRAPSEGSIQIDDELFDTTKEHLSLGYVPQDVVLFDGGFGSNISLSEMGDWDAERILWAIKLAGLYDVFTTDFNCDLLQTVGENGNRLSGGQRQRVAIARALYTNPEILWLDEATSGLDKATIEALLSDLKSLTSQLTVVLVSHQDQVVRAADNLIEIN